MKVALPYWHERISPVLDVAVRFLLVTMDNGTEATRQEVFLEETSPLSRARELRSLDVEVIICGAVSRPLVSALRSEGIQVIAYTCGQVDEVLKAFAGGRLGDRAYVMPGCSGRHRHRRVGDDPTD